jgi:hypothetical protein
VAELVLNLLATSKRGTAKTLAWVGVAIVGVGIVVGAWGSVMSTSFEAAPLPPPLPAESFDGAQAYQYLVEICKLGSRMTATPAMRRQQEILQKHFEALGATVELQRFTATQPSRGKRSFECTNLVVHWHPESTRRVLLGAHYDTRPHADEEPLPRNRAKPIIGANDGASGVALLMELGRLVGKLELNVGVDFVLFDAEEYIFSPGVDRYFLGSEYFVAELGRRPPVHRYDAVVVVDMIADEELEIYPDQASAVRAGALVREIWDVAGAMRARPFKTPAKYDILDDHIAFQKAGIPAIVLIDFDYPHWHRLSDTPDKCSAASLQTVGRVLVEWLKRK